MAPDGPDSPGDLPPLPRTDYDRMALRYETGRSIPEEGLQAWRAALSTYLPPVDSMPTSMWDREPASGRGRSLDGSRSG
jgi:hypothetical protein